MKLFNPFDKNNYYVRKALGKDEKEIIVYKFKTMFDGADQMEVFQLAENLDGLGKVVKDSRIIPGREWMRKTHFDELPNLYSYFILRNLDFVGIRPKSKDDWKPFSKYHVKKALQFKPGLNGAIYAYTNLRDFQDLQDAEMEYILKKEKNPTKTDLEYFSKIIYNKTILMEKSK